MPSVGTTLQTLVERVANRYNLLEEVTTASTNGGTTTTAVAAALWQPNGAYEGKWAFYRSSTVNAGEERQVKQSSQASTSITFSYAMTATVQNSVTVQLYSRFSHAQIVNAINDTIRHSGGHWWQDVVDESLTFTTGDYSISLSTLNAAVEARYGLTRVSWEINTAESTYPFEPILDWRLRWSATTPTLEFGKRTYTGGRTIRLEYRAAPATMTNPTDQTGVDVDTWFDDFVVEYALFELFQQRSSFAPKADKRQDAQLAQMHRDEAERIRRMHSMRQPSHKVRSKSQRDVGDSRNYFGAFSP